MYWIGCISDGLFSAPILILERRIGCLTASTGSEIGHDVPRSSDCRLMDPVPVCLLIPNYRATAVDIVLCHCTDVHG